MKTKPVCDSIDDMLKYQSRERDWYDSYQRGEEERDRRENAARESARKTGRPYL